MKRRIRLTESNLHRIIKESVKRTLNEISIDTIRSAHKNARDDFWAAKRQGDEKRAKRRFRQADRFADALPEVQKERAYQRALKDAGLYDYSGTVGIHNSISPEYKKYGNVHIPSEDMRELLSNIENPTGEDAWKAWTDRVNPSLRRREILNSHQAEFENACDYLYYGYGFNSWLKTCDPDMSEEDANIIWRAAFNHMANAD